MVTPWGFTLRLKSQNHFVQHGSIIKLNKAVQSSRGHNLFIISDLVMCSNTHWQRFERSAISPTSEVIKLLSISLYLQLSRIRLHFCTSVGNFCKYMRHDATTNNLEKAVTFCVIILRIIPFVILIRARGKSKD